MNLITPLVSGAQALADFLFPVSLEDTLPIDETEALPVADVEYIGMNDAVRYEYLDEDGHVLRAFEGKVIDVCYETQRVLVYVKGEGATWCGIERVSPVTNGKAVSSAFAAELTA